MVDDTLLHKGGQKVYGLGWFRDAVASTAKRVATASGNNWVVMGLAILILVVPRADPLSAAVGPRALARAGGDPSRCGLGGGDARLGLLPVPRSTDRPDRGWRLRGPRLARGLGPAGSVPGAELRGDAEIYDPQVPPQPAGERGCKPQKGSRLPSPARGGEPGPTAIATARSPGRGVTSR